MFPTPWRLPSKQKSGSTPRKSRPGAWRRRLPLYLEPLEDRTLLTVQPLTLADPSYFGISGNNNSAHPSVSTDGQLVAFQSDAADLVPGDTNGQPDAFVYNRTTATVTLVSRGIGGMAAGLGARFGDAAPVVSPDGRFVAFENNKGNVLPGVTGDQLYLDDLAAGTTTLLSAAVKGGGGDNPSYGPVFSADGHHVVFVSDSDNLVAGMAPYTGVPEANLFERDLTTGTTTLVSTDGTSVSDYYGGGASVSADGRFVAYLSRVVTTQANNPGSNNPLNVVVRDMATGAITLASVNAAGTAAGNASSALAPGAQSLSADGRYVAFDSTATDLVAGNVSGQNVYLRDLVTGVTTLVSALPNGSGADKSGNEIISPDGRYVAFTSGTDGLVPQDTNGHLDVYVRDNLTGKLSLASVNAAGTNGGNNTSGSTNHPYDFSTGGLAFSADSRHLAFQSSATDLTAGVATGQRNLYERDLVAGTTTLVTPAAAGGDGGDNASYAPALSADGRVVAFESVADNLVAGDANRAQDVFVRDTAAAGTALASLRTPLLPAERLSNRGGSLQAATPDGRFVAFVAGGGTDAVPGVAVDAFSSHVFVRDRQTGAVQVVDVTPDGKSAPDNAFAPALTPDGRYVVFLGQSTALVTGITYYAAFRETMAFERDLQTGTTRLVSVNPAGTHDVNVIGGEVAVSADGRYVAFVSSDTSAVAGLSNPNGHRAVFLRDMQTGTTVLVSHDLANDGQINGDSYAISLSADGRYVLFDSQAPDLAANDTNKAVDVFRWDRTTGRVALVSVNAAGTGPGNGTSGDSTAFPTDTDAYRPAMTPDGRYVVFGSEASDLVPGDTNGALDVFVRDMTAGTTTLVSVNQAGTASGNGYSGYGQVSADGRYVAFASSATNLVGLSDTNGKGDYFVRDLQKGTTTLVSVNAAGTAAGNGGPGTHAVGPYGGFWDRPALSADGRYVAFRSTATDLVPGIVDGNGPDNSDLFVRDLRQGTTKWVSVNDSGTAGGNADNGNGALLFTSDGGTLFFDSAASDLFPGDLNGTTDVFAAVVPGTSTISGRVFNDANANGAADTGETGLANWTVFLDVNGNGKRDVGEPLVLTDAAGRYAFTGLTPSTYTVAVVPQANYTQTLPASAAAYTVTIAADGTTAAGKDFGEGIVFPDLAVQNVAFSPATAGPGQPVTVTWTVTNQGNAAAAGDWQDAVYLSSGPTLDASARLLATVPHTGGLAVGKNYPGSATVALPPVAGTYYLIVQADRRAQVNEGPDHANKANNVAASSGTLTVSVPTLTLGQPLGDQLTAGAPDRYYQLTAPAGPSLVLALAGAAGGQVELYVKRGGLPTTYDFDYAARTPGQAAQALTVPAAQPGVYYVLVHGVSGAALTGSFTLTADEPGLGLQALGLTAGGNGGRVTIPVHGTDLTPGTQVSLVSGGTAVAPVAVQFVDGSLLYATFDLSGQPAGKYDLRVVSGSHSASLPGAFNIETARGPDLHVHLSAPAGIRVNSPHGNLVIDYENDGDTDMPAPVFQLTTTAGTLTVLRGGAFASGKAIQFVASGSDGPGGVLRAGGKGKVEVLLRLPENVGIGGGGGSGGTGSSSSTVGPGDTITVKLSTLPTDATPVDWGQLKGQFQPPSVPNDAWEVVWNNFTSSVGSTTGQLQSALVSDTAYLNQIGMDNPTVPQLLAFELLRADADLPVPTLAGTTDVSFPAPGLGLDFGRQFFQSISGRERLGVLGRGWVSDWDISAAVQANGDALVSDAGTPRLFQKQADGSFAGQPGDYGTLSLVNGLYRLREKDGTVTGFRADGKLDFVQDADGNRITAGYNGAGQLVSLTHSDGKALTITYNAQGRIGTVTDPAGRVATYGYDASGEHLTSVTTVNGVTQYGYVTGQGAAREHALTAVTFPDGTQQHFTYDAQGRLAGSFRGTTASPIDPVTITYPSPGGVTFTDAAGSNTVLFNQLGRPAVVSDALGHSVRSSYDASGNLTGVLLPGGLTYSYGYDAHGNVVRVTDPLGQETDFTYDDRTNVLTNFRDARGKTTTYRSDAQGNLLAITYPDGNHQNFQYDPLGNLTETINARGHAIGYAHDAAGRLTKVSFADGSHQDYTYDSHGNLKTAALTNAGGNTSTTTLQYDAADRLTEVDYPGAQYLKFTYNAGGQRTQSVDQTGFTINYAYDAAGRLAGLTDGNGKPIVTYTYDAAGRLSEKDLGNGTYTTYAYDPAGELLHLVNHAPRPAAGQDGPVNSRFDYTYDDLGRVGTETTSDGAWVYTYDADGQLTRAVFTSNNAATLPNQDLQYFYDAAGNRTKTISNGVTTTYTVNDLNEYTQVGSAVYTYDADGNLKTKTDGGATTTYTFDDLNRLTGVGSPSDTFGYAFDALGNLSATTHNGSTTTSLNDPTGFGNITGLGTIFGEFSGGSAVAHYAWGLGLVSRTDASGPAYYDFDALGSTAGMTNAAGTYVNRYSYLPFGETTALRSGLANPFTFVGQFGVTTGGNGLLRMGFRNYDPLIGQFASDDPLGITGGDTNIRRYVGNNPLGLVDPLGTKEQSPQEILGQLEKQIDKADDDVESYHYAAIAEASDPTLRKSHLKDELNSSHRLVELKGIRDRLDASLVQGIKQNFDGQNPFGDSPSTNPVFIALIPILGAGDPNQLIGPAGFGAQHWVTPQQTLPYTIDFENDPKKANAPAQDVTVTEPLDPNLDWSTFQLGVIQFGSTVVTVPAGLQSFATSVNTTNTDGTPLRVDVTAGLNQQTGVVTWTFHSIDPATGLTPEDPLAGFLPVDDNTHRGQGSVSYTVRPKAGLATGTRLTAQASIVFDTNAALSTNAYANTVLNDPPGPPPRTLALVAGAFSHSDEYYANFITGAYQQYLGRKPDGAGLTAWVAAMRNGLSDERLEAGFLGSDEYIAGHGGRGAGWVKGMYKDLLGRANPSQAEVDAWVNALANGIVTPYQVALGFAASAEREGQRITADYEKYVGRAPEPGAVPAWVQAFQAGTSNESVVAGFVGSVEYYLRHGGNIDDWLIDAYQDILGRPPDDGFQSWLQVLRAG